MLRPASRSLFIYFIVHRGGVSEPGLAPTSPTPPDGDDLILLYARHLARRACAARACAARARASRDLWHCWLASAPALLQCQDFGHRRQLRAYLWGGGVDDCLGEHTSGLTQQKVLLLDSRVRHEGVHVEAPEVQLAESRDA